MPHVRQPPPDSLATLASVFREKVEDLQQATALRCADLSPHAASLDALEATLQSLGARLQEVEAVVQRERAHFPQAAALSQALDQQASHLRFISENLPPFLPAASHPQPKAAPPAPDGAADAPQQGKENDAPPHPTANMGAQPGDAAQPEAANKQKKAQAPRRYITSSDLDSVSSYMRNRITLDKVNAAVDDIASLAEGNARLLAAARSGGHSLSVEEHRHAQVLKRNIASRTDVRGQHWILERDCRRGTAIRLDKTGKSILQILRHLGRLQELHCQVDEGYENVLVLV